MANPWHGNGTFLASDVLSDNSWTSIGIREGAQYLWVNVHNGADKVLDAFQIRPVVSAAANCSDVTLFNATSDYSSSSDMQWPMLGCSADLTTLAASTPAVFAMDARALSAVEMRASGNSSDTTITYYWNLR